MIMATSITSSPLPPLTKRIDLKSFFSQICYPSHRQSVNLNALDSEMFIWILTLRSLPTPSDSSIFCFIIAFLTTPHLGRPHITHGLGPNGGASFSFSRLFCIFFFSLKGEENDSHVDGRDVDLIER